MMLMPKLNISRQGIETYRALYRKRSCFGGHFAFTLVHASLRIRRNVSLQVGPSRSPHRDTFLPA